MNRQHTSNTGIANFIIKNSGGLIKTERQLSIVAGIILVVVLWFLFQTVSSSPGAGAGDDIPPPYDAASDVPPEGQYDYD